MPATRLGRATAEWTAKGDHYVAYLGWKKDSVLGRFRCRFADKLRSHLPIEELGLELLGLSLLAVKPKPETAKALEAETREALLRQADEAVYVRRNAAVAQERTIKENEYATAIAVEIKKRQVREAQLEAERSVQERELQLRRNEMAGKVGLEEQNKELVALSSANARKEADAKAYGLSAMMRSIGDGDPRILQALASVRMNPGQLCQIASNCDPFFAPNRDPSGGLIELRGMAFTGVGRLWVSGLPERPFRVRRRQATYPQRTARTLLVRSQFRFLNRQLVLPVSTMSQ